MNDVKLERTDCFKYLGVIVMYSRAPLATNGVTLYIVG